MHIREVHEQFSILTMYIDVLAKEDKNRHLRPQVSLLMLRLYHLRKKFAVSMKFVSQHVKHDGICKKWNDHK